MKKTIIIFGIILALILLTFSPVITSVEVATTTHETKPTNPPDILNEFTIAYVTGCVIMPQRPEFFHPIFLAESGVQVKCIIPHVENEQPFNAPVGSHILSRFAIWLHADRFPGSDVWQVTVLMIGSGKVFTD